MPRKSLFQSTLPVWGATFRLAYVYQCYLISIHAPRGGSDAKQMGRVLTPDGISIHAPRVGSDGALLALNRYREDFNPRSPCGERHRAFRKLVLMVIISIHAPRVGSDRERGCTQDFLTDFNPRSPCGERRGKRDSMATENNISIHAPRVGSDVLAVLVAPWLANFNPRSPCGERRAMEQPSTEKQEFQSTLPVGGATKPCKKVIRSRGISIHAPRGGSDRESGFVTPKMAYFNPRSPWGERQLGIRSQRRK